MEAFTLGYFGRGFLNQGVPYVIIKFLFRRPYRNIRSFVLLLCKRKRIFLFNKGFGIFLGTNISMWEVDKMLCIYNYYVLGLNNKT